MKETNKTLITETRLADFKVGVDNIIFSVDTERDRLLVLLVKRDTEPFKGKWSLPGTLVRQEESLKQAAYRILAEKIWADNLYLEQLYTFSNANQYEEELLDYAEKRYLSVSYFALLRFEEADLIVSNHQKNIDWYSLDELPKLAFNHEKMIQYGYKRLRNKLAYSPIAFKVLPEFFTLYEVYQLYTIILGENFADYSNFRAKLLKLNVLQDIGIKSNKNPGRPASLYRFDVKSFLPLKDKHLLFI